MTNPIDDYIAGFDGDRRDLMVALRALIRSIVPEADEAMSYGMPTFKLNGNLVHFAAHAHHVGFYPGPDGVEFALGMLEGRTHSKGAIQFPADEPLPVDLVRAVVEFRVGQQRAKKKH